MNCRSLLCCALAPLALLLWTADAAGQPTTTQPASSNPPETQPAQTQSADDLQARLDRLTAELERQMDEHHVPGLAVAVVRGDDVLLCTGLGVANLDTGEPVTGDTVFAIGSSTKAFTATLVGMLIDDGVIESWDDQPQQYLPAFQLNDEQANEQVSFRDLLAHRTGLSRMGLLWASGALSRNEIIAHVPKAELLHPFRKQFHYSNINYIVAGEASARAADMAWHELLHQKLLDPLDMTDATIHTAEAKATGRFATGYRWHDEKEAFEPENLRDLAIVAPAGAINASARAMANWLRFQISRGTFDGKQLISEDTLTETWKPQIDMPAGNSYGLGWMIGQWNGHTLIQHGGNIDGYAAQVALLPEKNLGFVLLTNTTVNNMQATANAAVFDALLRDPATDDGKDIDFAPYLGRYIADFGPFSDDHFTVLVQNGNLAVDVPQQMVYELKPPDEQGRWTFAITDQIAVSFERDDKGEIIALNMHQGGLTFELPREGVEIEPEVALSEVREYLGKYHDERLDADIEVLIHNGRLAADVPGQMIYELHTPDELDGRWIFRATDKLWIEFNRSDDGAIESLTLTEHGQPYELPRVGGPADDEVADLPTLEAILALHNTAHGTANLDNLETYIATGSVRFVHQGIDGAVTAHVRGVDAYRLEIDLGKPGEIITCATASHGWSASAFDPLEVLEGSYLEAAQRQHPLLIARDLRAVSDELKLKDVTELDGRTHYALSMKMSDRVSSTLYIDAETGLVTREDLATLDPAIGAIPMQVRYSDYRDVNGVQLPARAVAENPFVGSMELHYESIEANIELPEDIFAIPDR